MESNQCGSARVRTPRHRHCPVSPQRRLTDPDLQRRDRRGVKSTGPGGGSHGALHHAQPLTAQLDYGFRPPVFRIERRERDRGGIGNAAEHMLFFHRSEKRRSIGS